jgi:hypothetical protein
MNAVLASITMQLQPLLRHRLVAPAPVVCMTDAELAALVRVGDLLLYDGAEQSGVATRAGGESMRAHCDLARLLAALLALLPCFPFALALADKHTLDELGIEDGNGGVPQRPAERPIALCDWGEWRSAALVLRVDATGSLTLLSSEHSLTPISFTELVSANVGFDRRLFAVRHLVINDEALLLSNVGSQPGVRVGTIDGVASALSVSGGQSGSGGGGAANAAAAAAKPIEQQMNQTARWRAALGELVSKFATRVANFSTRLAASKQTGAAVELTGGAEAVVVESMKRSSAFGALYALYNARVFSCEPRLADAASLLQSSGAMLRHNIADAYTFTDARCIRLV